MRETEIDPVLLDDRWLRRLARRLVVNHHDAEDLIQEGRLAALTRPPRDSGALRGWLSTVVRNAARLEHRAADRRNRRERLVARSECVPSEEHLLEGLERARIVIETVQELSPIYRQAILYRYYSDLSPPEIAQVLDVPLKTVHTRLHRAEEQLRIALERRFGSSHDLRAALLPLLIRPEVSPVTASVSMSVGGLIVMKKLGTAALIVVLCVLGYWSGDRWVFPERAEAPVEGIVADAGPGVLRATAPEEVHGAPESTSGEVRETADHPEPVSRASESREELAGKGKAPLVRGVVLAFDLEGEPLPFVDCGFRLVEWQGGGGGGVESRISGAEWTARVRRGAELGFSNVVVDGKPAVARQDRYAIPESGVLEVEVDLLPAKLLIVRGAETREELREVYVASRQQATSPSEVASEHLLVDGEPSPIELLDDRRDYFVGAPGFAWTRAEVDRRRGGDYEVILEKAASVTITIKGLHGDDLHGDEQPYFTLNRVISGFVRSTAPVVRRRALGSLELSHLAPGEYEARLQEKFWDPSQVLVASARFQLPAGTHTEVELVSGVVHGQRELVDVRGTIQVSTEDASRIRWVRLNPWDRERVNDRKMIRRKSMSFEEGEDHSRIHWKARLKPGKYVLALDSFQVRRVIEVTPDLRDPVEVNLTAIDLADLYVRVVAADTGEELAPEHVGCTTMVPEGLPGYGGQMSRRQEPGGLYHFVSVPGRCNLHAEIGDHAGGTSVELREGVNEVTLELSRTTGVHLIYEHEGARISVPRTTRSPEFKAIEGAGKAAGWGTSSARPGAVQIKLSEPGRYTVDFTPVELAGFRPIPPRQIEVRPGEWIELVVQLEATEEP